MTSTPESPKIPKEEKTAKELIERATQEVPLSLYMRLEDALEHLASRTLELHVKEPLLVVLFGYPGAGKTTFLKRFHALLQEKDPVQSTYSYAIGADEDRKERIQDFLKTKKDHEARFPILILESVEAFGPDLAAVENLNRFPEIYLVIYDPEKGKPKVQNLQKQIIEWRRDLAQKYSIPFLVPDFIFIENPRPRK